MASGDSRSADETDKILTRVREDIASQTDQEKFFVDKNVFGRCWGRIRPWLHWSSLIHHMFRWNLASDYQELLYMTTDNMRNQKEKIALFEMLERHAGLGFHIMYICIKDDHENELGHKSAVEELEKCARETQSRPPSSVSSENIDSASRIQPESIISQEETKEPGQGASDEASRASQLSPQQREPRQPQPCSEESVPVARRTSSTSHTTLSSIDASIPYTERYDTSALSEDCPADGLDQMVSSAIYTVNGPTPPAKSSSMLDGQFHTVSPDVDQVGVSTVRPDPPPSDCILEFVKLMLKYRRADLAPGSCELQLKSPGEFSSVEKLIKEAVTFLVSCLNSRAQGLPYGVLLAGVLCQPGSSSIADAGLNLPFVPLPGQVWDAVKKVVHVRRGGSWQRVDLVSLTSLARLEMLPVGEGENPPQVLVVIVRPTAETCQDFLFAQKPENGSAVSMEAYVRKNGQSKRVAESELDQLQQKLAEHYATCHN